jgi:multidrug efflux pump subunit AcrA (membrane-fusion protein)
MSTGESAQFLTLATQTVGSETEAFATAASWPGEIISPNDADIQPPREGTIIAWNVAIGQYVKRGQTLGQLSATPLTPELAKTLADQTESLTRARANVSSTQSFVAQTGQQIQTFSRNDNTQQAIVQAESIVRGAEDNMRSVLRQAVSKEFPEFAVYGDDAFTVYRQNRIHSIALKQNFGVLNSRLREEYISALVVLIQSIENNGPVEQAGKKYLTSSLSLVSASIADDSYSQSKLDELKKTILLDQTELNEAVEKYRDALLDVSEKQKEYAERNRDSSNRITELEREKILARNDLVAAEAAHQAVTQALSGGAVIVAPRYGYISALTKQVGEFVTPGTSVASISSGVQTDKMVRFRIPSNAEVPKKGDNLRVVRPGFAKDVMSATVIGVGTALDGNGAFMADAKFEGKVEWPAHLSVRVLPSKQALQNIAVPFDAVWWDENNHPHVWVVSEGKIASRAVTTGRTFGDAVEILSGLTQGETYVSLPTDDLKEGMKIKQPVETPATMSEPEGDGHGHAHEE